MMNTIIQLQMDDITYHTVQMLGLPDQPPELSWLGLGLYFHTRSSLVCFLDQLEQLISRLHLTGKSQLLGEGEEIHKVLNMLALA